MAKKDQLAPLILSLTPAEKKYFIRFASLRSDDKSYMALYNCIQRDKVFDSEKLSKELKKTKANLAHEKEYLIEIILKALRNFHDTMPVLQLNNAISDSHILKERQLNHLSLRSIKKATALAKKCARPEINWRMQFEQRLLAVHLNTEKNFLKDAAANLGNMEVELNRLQDFTALQRLSFESERLYRTRAYVRNEQEREETKRLLNSPLLKIRTKEPLFRLCQLNTIASIQEQLGEDNNGLKNLKQLLSLIENNPNQTGVDTYGYFLALHSYLNELVFARRYKEFDKLMSKVKARYYHKFPFNSPQLDALLDAHSYCYYLMQYNFFISEGNPQIEKTKELLNDFEKNYMQVIKMFPDGYSSPLFHYACGLCFYLKDYAGALKWNRRIIDEGKPGERTEIQSIARIVTPMLHAQLKNYSILPSLVKSATRYLQKTGYLTGVEKATLAHLNKLPTLHSNASIKAAFADLKKQYTALQTTDEGAYRIRAFKYRTWVEQNL